MFTSVSLSTFAQRDWLRSCNASIQWSQRGRPDSICKTSNLLMTMRTAAKEIVIRYQDTPSEINNMARWPSWTDNLCLRFNVPYDQLLFSVTSQKQFKFPGTLSMNGRSENVIVTCMPFPSLTDEAEGLRLAVDASGALSGFLPGQQPESVFNIEVGAGYVNRL